jgi:hypothetical protein
LRPPTATNQQLRPSTYTGFFAPQEIIGDQETDQKRHATERHRNGSNADESTANASQKTFKKILGPIGKQPEQPSEQPTGATSTARNDHPKNGRK